MKQLIRYLLIGIVLPLTVHYMVYYRFTPNYLPNVYSKDGFEKMYKSSVFKYRVIGVQLQLFVYEKLQNTAYNTIFKEHDIYKSRLKALDANADELFYAAYFLINTFCCIVMSMLLLFLFKNSHFYRVSIIEQNMLICLLVMLIGLTQYVVTPYDNLSYMMMVLTFLFFLMAERKNKAVHWLLLAVLMFITTLVRESSLLLLSMMLTVGIRKYGMNIKAIAQFLWPPVAAFALAYLGIRWYVSESMEVAQALRFWDNFNIVGYSKIIALLFATVLLYSLFQYAKTGNVRLFKIFVWVSAPYFLFIMLVGLLIEFRLWMPFVIGAILLIKLNEQKLIESKEMMVHD